MTLTIFNYLFYTILGLVFGSFVGALTWRLPRKVSVVKGRSFCPKCRKTIRWFDNLPLISFIRLKGRCRYCRRRISLRYPLIELTAVFGFLVLQGRPFYLLIFLITLAILVIDIEHRMIPDNLAFVGYVFTLLFLLFFKSDQLYPHLFTGFGASLILLLLHYITRGRGMGLGDVKLVLFLGTYFEPIEMIVWLLLSFVTGALVGVILMILGRAKLKSLIAFGPFLIISFWLVFLLGPDILKLVIR